MMLMDQSLAFGERSEETSDMSSCCLDSCDTNGVIVKSETKVQEIHILSMNCFILLFVL